MYYLWFLGGVFIGSILSNMFFRFRTKTGVLEIDPIEQTHQLKINGVLTNRTRKLLLKIDHYADLSQK